MEIKGVGPVQVQPLFDVPHFHPFGSHRAGMARPMVLVTDAESETEAGIEDRKGQPVVVMVGRIGPVGMVIPASVVITLDVAMMMAPPVVATMAPIIMMAPVMAAMTFIMTAMIMVVSLLVTRAGLTMAPTAPAAGPRAGGQKKHYRDRAYH